MQFLISKNDVCTVGGWLKCDQGGYVQLFETVVFVKIPLGSLLIAPFSLPHPPASSTATDVTLIRTCRLVTIRGASRSNRRRIPERGELLESLEYFEILNGKRTMFAAHIKLEYLEANWQSTRVPSRDPCRALSQDPSCMPATYFWRAHYNARPLMNFGLV